MGCMFHLSEILSIIQCCNFYSPTARESLKISKQACFERYLEMLCQNTSRDGFLAVPLAKQVVNRARPHLLEWLTWRIKGWTRGTVMHQLPCDVKCADGLQRWLSGKPIKQRSNFWRIESQNIYMSQINSILMHYFPLVALNLKTIAHRMFIWLISLRWI